MCWRRLRAEGVRKREEERKNNEKQAPVSFDFFLVAAVIFLLVAKDLSRTTYYCKSSRLDQVWMGRLYY